MQRKAKPAAAGLPPEQTTPLSENVDTEDIDFDWEAEQSATRPRKPREAMPTLHDDDPLRHDPSYRKKRKGKRDSMPTLPDIDPLRHDVDDEPSGGEQ
jgi:hypothetical protein